MLMIDAQLCVYVILSAAYISLQKTQLRLQHAELSVIDLTINCRWLLKPTVEK
jgi:hypothetical protein